MTDAEKFMTFMGNNYERLMDKMQRYCQGKNVLFDEDIFGDTVLKIYEKIAKDGIDDSTDAGFENYFFISFKTNMIRERQYSRNQKNDDNVSQDVIGEVYDKYYNEANDSSIVKLTKDLSTDFKTLQVLLTVEKHFSQEQYYLFKLKFLEQLTYKQLAERTGIRDARNKVLEVLTWLRENADEIRADIEEAFKAEYGDWLEYQ